MSRIHYIGFLESSKIYEQDLIEEFEKCELPLTFIASSFQIISNVTENSKKCIFVIYPRTTISQDV